jgi:hypothetical protein
MRLRISAAVLVTACIGCVSAEAATPPRVLTLDGAGGVHPGMSATRVDAIWGVHLKVEASGASPGCANAGVRIGPIIGGAMFQDGLLQAAWFTHGVRTPSGIRIGSTRSQLTRTYGSRLTRVPALYTRGLWLYYLRRSQSPHWRLRFDVSAAGRVTSIGFGANNYVTAQEGCA